MPGRRNSGSFDGNRFGGGTSVKEQTLRMEDLLSADEVFITSTNRNAIGVKEIAGQQIGNGSEGEITKRLDIS